MLVNNFSAMIKRSIALDNYKLVVLLGFILILSGCIEEFNPEINNFDELLVINGSIIKGDSIQTITISKSKPFYETEYNGITGYQVRVENDQSIQFPFTETTTGIYTAVIPEAYLAYNSKFKLRVIGPDGSEYESEYESILESAPIDEIYPINEPYQSSSEQHNEGLQFYVDLKASGNSNRNYRWKLEETWEYRSSFAIDGYFYPANSTLEILARDYSLYYCWSTEDVKDIYTASTENLSINEKKMIPLIYVPGGSIKLFHQYSLLVKQYVLSESAYEYWERNRIATAESGGLYQTQPSQSKSNIYNINNPNEIVLGFFWASSYTQKRISYDDGPLIKSNSYLCIADTLDLGNPSVDFNIDFYYITVISQTPAATFLGISSNSCFDCTQRGGVTTKPDFMP